MDACQDNSPPPRVGDGDVRRLLERAGLKGELKRRRIDGELGRDGVAIADDGAIGLGISGKKRGSRVRGGCDADGGGGREVDLLGGAGGLPVRHPGARPRKVGMVADSMAEGLASTTS